MGCVSWRESGWVGGRLGTQPHRSLRVGFRGFVASVALVELGRRSSWATSSHCLNFSATKRKHHCESMQASFSHFATHAGLVWD